MHPGISPDAYPANDKGGDHLVKRFINFFKNVVIIGFCIILVVTLVAVFMRYVLVSPLKWAEEFSRYIFVWTVMISVGLGLLDGEHIALNLFTAKLNLKWQTILYIFDMLLISIFDIVLIYFGTTLAVQNMSVKSPAMHIPIGIAYAGIPVGSVIIMVFVVICICRKLKLYREAKKLEGEEK